MKKELQVRKCPREVGLWTSLWIIFLIKDQCGWTKRDPNLAGINTELDLLAVHSYSSCFYLFYYESSVFLIPYCLYLLG